MGSLIVGASLKIRRTDLVRFNSNHGPGYISKYHGSYYL